MNRSVENPVAKLKDTSVFRSANRSGSNMVLIAIQIPADTVDKAKIMFVTFRLGIVSTTTEMIMHRTTTNIPTSGNAGIVCI
ncbi:hypothetical protein KC640_02195 [Candidatus Dojkabacteria bacterium]|uniref:Uncharacterized protein n=1 Tax=Candidatus Dojkabacteria bacterium TaxID=2099670 RepID=A0A955I5D5_9BACT|nr:hypothetical protein [Candidatus Dojkabacteria bacterium]